MTGAEPGVERSLPAGTAHLIALAGLSGVGPAALLRCAEPPGPEAAWAAAVGGHPERSGALADATRRMSPEAVAHLVRVAQATDPVEELARHQAAGRRVLVRGVPGYPRRLADDPAPPALLFAAGRQDLVDGPTVAIVGTRNATRPGRDLASLLGAELVAAGVSVVSGLALGIDGAAHTGALAARAAIGAEGGGSAAGDRSSAAGPIGVIASGLDVVYPRRHAELHARVAGEGLLLSETPLGLRPTAWRFPARNRIIAALADAVVVVESRARGGSMLTVAQALDRGVPVLAVPGHPGAPAAAGTNDLLFDGAAIVRSVDDVLDAIGRPRPSAASASGRSAAPPPAGVQREVLAAIGLTPAALAEVVARTGEPLEAVAEALVHLEALGHVVRTAGWYERATSIGAGR